METRFAIQILSGPVWRLSPVSSELRLPFAAAVIPQSQSPKPSRPRKRRRLGGYGTTVNIES